MQGEDGLVVVRGRVEIDMRQPFRSVREAVTLFGEKILARQVYGNLKLKQMQMCKGASTSTDGRQYDHKSNIISSSKYGAAAEKLEETKQSLQKAKEEGDMMAHCLTSLRQELEHTKKELHQIKMMSQRSLDTADHDQPPASTESTEELKFVSSAKISTRNPSPDHVEEADDTGFEFNKQQRRSVKFASTPLLTKLITDDHTNDKDVKDEGEPHTHSGKMKIKRKIKPFVPLIGGLFSKNKKLGGN